MLDCVKYVMGFGVPMLVLGGGGYTSEERTARLDVRNVRYS